jgi:hypothetical protein
MEMDITRGEYHSPGVYRGGNESPKILKLFIDKCSRDGTIKNIPGESPSRPLSFALEL